MSSSPDPQGEERRRPGAAAAELALDALDRPRERRRRAGRGAMLRRRSSPRAPRRPPAAPRRGRRAARSTPSRTRAPIAWRWAAGTRVTDLAIQASMSDRDLALEREAGRPGSPADRSSMASKAHSK